jgi:serine/threonine protein kinase/tetratricopeptide (TPR) repeat protein
MATVFLARDLRLSRPVAIKVVRPELAAAVGAERFLGEVRVTANLQHPNLVPLFESGEAGGLLYYVMPFIDGESLRDRLAREGQLRIDEALQITREIADGLEHAHRAGIIHRDIKPENVLLTGGHAVLMDFGIARAVNAAGSPRLTEVGLAIGTPPYMSPEQSLGESELDGRSDQYSLATVLFELLAGEPPYTGPNPRAILARQLRDAVPSLRSRRDAVPEYIEKVIARGLAKIPADRFDTVTAFAEALRNPPTNQPRPRSVAVLPFLNLSTDPENEHFSDGITEDVIAQLSKIRALHVISRTSVMPFKARTQGLREIASQLHVATMVEGSVRRVADRVRIVAQLVDGQTDEHLWSETYDRQLIDIFAIQTEVALQIAGALQAELSPGERSRIAREPTGDVRAYQLFLQGRHSLVKYTEESMLAAIAYFQQAIGRDPLYAMAYAGIAMAYTELSETGGLSPEDAAPRARTAATRALAIDPELGDAHCAAAYVRFVLDFDWAGAEAGLRRALELSPGTADIYDLYGRLCSALGRFDEAVVFLQRAQELDPMVHRADLATAYLRAGRYDEALEAVSRAAPRFPDDPRVLFTLGWAYFGKQRFEEGLATMQHAVALSPEDTLWLGQLGQACAIAGNVERAEEILRGLEEQAKRRYVSPYHLAYVYTGLGQHERALDCLEQAYHQRAGAVYGIRGSFLFAPLREHPRFRALLEGMNLE